MGAVQKMEIPRETFSSSLGQDFPKLDPKFMAKKSCSRQNNRTHISQIEQTQQVVNWYEWERSTWPVAFFIEPDVPPNAFSVNQYQMIKFQTIRIEHSEIPGTLWSTHASQKTAIMEKDWPTNSLSKRPVLGAMKILINKPFQFSIGLCKTPITKAFQLSQTSSPKGLYGDFPSGCLLIWGTSNYFPDTTSFKSAPLPLYNHETSRVLHPSPMSRFPQEIAGLFFRGFWSPPSTPS